MPRQAKKGLFWSVLFTIMIVNLGLFNMILWLLRPIWFDINNFIILATGISINWLLAIFLLTLILIFYSGLQVYLSSKQLKMNQKYIPRLINKIIPFIILIIWNGLLFFLLSELGSEIGVIEFQFLEVLNGILITVFITTLVLFLPMINIWKNVWFRFGLLLVVFFIAGWVITNPGAPRIVVGPYLQAPTDASMTVVWITDDPCVSWVEYGQNGHFDKKSYSVEKGLIEANQTLHKIKLDGLDPGTTYDYRIVSKKIKGMYPYNVEFGKTLYGEQHSFTTLDSDKDKINFLVINDIHENVELLHKLILMEESEHFDFVVFNGDTLNNIVSEQQLIKRLLKPASELFATEIPFILVRGNHETRGKFARKLPDYIDIPNSEYYYSFTHGPARFLILDSGEDKEDNHIEYSGLVDFESYRNEEKEWLRQVVEEDVYRDADFRIALSHIPLNEFQIFDSSEPYRAYQLEWSEILNSSGLDLMLSGHHHITMTYEPKGAVEFPIIIGGGSAYDDNSYSILRVAVDRDTIKILFKDAEGNIIDTYTIEKNKIE